MTALATSVQGDGYLKKKAIEIKTWFDSGPQTIEGLIVRKMPSRLESVTFTKAKDKAKDTARFQLILHKKYQEWAIDLEMKFYYQPWLNNEGLTRPSGIMFCVVNSEEGKSLAIDYLPIDFSPEQDSLNAPQLSLFWVQKLLKRPSVKYIFAHKRLIATDLDE